MTTTHVSWFSPYTAAYGDLVMGEGDNGKRVGDEAMVELA